VAIQVGSGENYVLDHLSLGWTTDKAVIIKKSATSWSHPVSRVTVQRSIMAEIFADHPTGMQISGEDNDGATDWKLIKDISLHRNLFAHNSHRNPNVTTVGTEVINNVIYNWRMGAVQSTRGSRLDVISNVFIPGPMTDSRYLYEVTWNCENDEGFEPSLYVAGNVGPNNDEPGADNWTGSSRMTACYYDTGGTPGVELPQSFRRNSPLDQPRVPVTVQSANAVRDAVLQDVGASSGLACDGGWIARSDAADRRVIGDVRNGTGPDAPPKNESELGGFPALDGGQPCADGDGDGMPDAFETRFGFDRDNPLDGMLDSDGDGYSNIEEYINASMS
jgi:pectate lyase